MVIILNMAKEKWYPGYRPCHVAEIINVIKVGAKCNRSYTHLQNGHIINNGSIMNKMDNQQWINALYKPFQP